MATTYNAGSASIRIAPDLSNFHKRVKQQLRAERFEAPVVVVPDMSKFAQKLEADLGRVRATLGVRIRPDFTGFRTALRSHLQAEGGGNVEVPLKLDLTQARAQLDAFRIEARVPITTRLNLDVTGALAQLAAVRAAAEGIGDTTRGLNGSGSGRNNLPGLRGGPIRRIRLQLELDRASVVRAQAELDAATEQLARSRRAGVDAADRVRIAEERLREIQQSSSASSSRLTQAQVNLTRAQRTLADETARSSRLFDQQRDAHNRLTRAQRDQGAASNLIRAGLGGIAEMAMNLGSSLTRVVSPASAVTVALLALAAVNIVPLIGQLSQALGVISLLPAVAASAAAAIATIVIGSTGVIDAFKAGTKAAEDADKDAAAASKAATQEAKARAAAAKGVESAQRGVESAVKGVERAEQGVVKAERSVQDAQKASLRAQQSLTDARKDAQEQIEDLNLALKGSSLDERDAELSLRRAQQRLAELGKDGQPVTALDFEEAYLGVDQAKQRIDEVRERNADLREETDKANRAGVEGSAQVIDAQDAVADAGLRVIDSKQAVVEANDGVAEAQRNLVDSHERLVEAQAVVVETQNAATTSADKYREALANLSPNARQFVEDTRDLGGAWSDLRLQVQDNLFEGMGSSITDLANNYFPILKDGLGGIATELNGGLRRAIEDLNTESVKLDWSNILDNTRLAIGPFMDGLSSLTGALTNIASIGSDFLPGGAESFAETMQGFEDWTESEEGQQRIRTFMQDSITALKEIKDLFLAIGDVIGGLFSTSEDNGKSMIQSMTDSLNEFADWMDTEEGKQRMEQFWDDAQQTAKDLLKLTGEAIKLADKVAGLTGSTFGLRQPGTADAPKVDAAGEDIGSGGQQIKFRAGIFPGVEEGSIGDKTFSFFGRLDDFFAGDSWGFLNAEAGESPFQASVRQAGEAFDGLKQKAAELAGGFVTNISETAYDAWNGLSSTISDKWNNNISPAIEAFKTGGLGGLADYFTDKITNGAIPTFGELPGAIGGVIGDIVSNVFPGLTTALAGVQSFFGTVVDGIGSKWNQLKELAAAPINWIIDTVINGGLKSAWNALEGVIPGLPKWEANIPRIEFGGAGMGPAGNKEAVQRFATGGHVRGAGGPTDDRVPAMLSNGEYVVKASAVKKIGVENLDRLNNNPLVAKGKVLAEGMFSGLRMATGGSVDEAIDRAKKFMSGEHGKPYQYGGVGDPSWDCSGLWSGIVHELSGRSARSGRLFNTESDFESMGWKPGLDGRVTIGIARGGGGPNSHMAGTIDGTNAESSGTNGVQWGGAAIGSDHSSFGLQYTLQELAGEFVSGGMGSGGGGGGGSLRSFLADKVADLLQKPMDAIGSSIPNFGSSMIGQLPRAAFNAISKAAVDFVKSKIGGSVSGRATAAEFPYDASAGVEQWDANIRAALAREGFEVNDRNVNLTKAQIMTESSGNPNAVQQVQDVNSGGNEAVGLMQVIPTTFDAYRNPDLPNDRTNPDASLSAALRWYRSRYGNDLGQMWGQGHGYANGGIIPGYTPGRDKFQVGVSGGEAIMRPEWTRAVGPNYVNSMNALAKKGGVDSIRNAMFQGFAAGGIVDPNEYLRNRLTQYGSEVAGIAKSAIPEILGISGTPLDLTNNRYVDAAMQIGSAVQGGITAATAPNYGSPTAPNMSRSVDSVLEDGARVIQQHTHFHVSNIDEAFRRHTVEQQRQALTFK
ncbi:transglycosylase SLT domain-containing protein [Rhodococcus sp. NPDC057297]|uniref:transglycosylase SLT domain-containing protein n=1 Tax=Rhodococcus sp. NPDC057297 TaxID=3346090 RepID=UPI0036412C10